MTKKIISVLLALCMVLGLSISAFADMELDLTDVTSMVVATMDVDEDYTDFSGNYNDGLTPTWDLYWSGDSRSLWVNCREDGTITYYNRWEDTGDPDLFLGFDPSFPSLTEAEAEQQAEYWLARLMGEGESARIDNVSASISDQYYRFSGTILLNGLESPITFSIQIGDIGPTYYTRSDAYSPYVGDVPSADAAVTGEEAAASLPGAVAFELYYVTDSDTGEARLRYIPEWPDTVVDAQTGDVVDMDALYASFYSSGSSITTNSAMAVGETDVLLGATLETGRDLTDTELESIANYADALDADALDAAMRQISGLGLDLGYELQRCSYSLNSETGDVTASLRYTMTMTKDDLLGYSSQEFQQYADWGSDMTVYKYITADAKTGEIQSVYTSYPMYQKDESASLAEEDLLACAEAFLTQIAPEELSQSEICTLSGYGERSGYTYARVHDGYFYPEHYLSVTLNAATGTIDSYYWNWDEEVQFADSEGIVSEDEALDAYIGAMDLTLGYISWPLAIERDDPIYAAYLDWGYTWIETLQLAYYYNGRNDIIGVDALTGEVLTYLQAADGSYVYDDIEGIPEQEAIEALAEAGIGFPEESFLPEEALTQRDAMKLLLQAVGYSAASWEDDRLQSQAAYYGLLRAEDWDPDATVTVTDLLRMIIGASPYGAAASLTGIWTGDVADVTEADQGTVAIAGALGLVDLASTELDATCTRAQGAAILYAFMT